MDKVTDTEWEKKWKAMIDHEKNKKLLNERLREQLQKKQELEETVECTFTPKTHLKPKDTATQRTKEDLIQIIFPIIQEEEAILRELNKIESDEKKRIFNLTQAIYTSVFNLPDYESRNIEDRIKVVQDNMARYAEFYKQERLKDIANVKALKLGIVGKLHNLERQFNLLCTNENIENKDLETIEYSIQNSRNIKQEILDSTGNYDTLRDRSRVTKEFENIVKNVQEDLMANARNERENMQVMYNAPAVMPMYGQTNMHYPIHHVGNAHLHPMHGVMGQAYPNQAPKGYRMNTQLVRRNIVPQPANYAMKHVPKDGLLFPVYPQARLQPMPNTGRTFIPRANTGHAMYNIPYGQYVPINNLGRNYSIRHNSVKH
ncbi:hypothetical protein BEWA_005780 [Theileria equi strain WA]|uniref:Uncharacterized protein n=1 Tax=Theileria equi strain WA TaxID=1537102 RepID=L0B022_THEEQ|nr:hypothetical protein BEWA_005780 [Theileria equi strain WA]AFZ81170.1 hypothetical protein BEWA_005780 [Theileria equi strain WA]|eukprot:XP_004830836.1 hypothetical protein BEWA_005780 [Theileria equi strain WA]